MPSRRILYLQYTNPAGYPPLEHSSRILADQGWEVLFVGTGALGAQQFSFPPHARIQVRQIRFCAAGWRQKLHYLWFCLWAAAWVARWKPAWIYASDLWACPPAWLASLLFRRGLIYHEHDSPNARRPGKSAFVGFCLWARRRCALRAAVCIVPNAQRAEWFQAETSAHKVVVVWNCPQRMEAALERNGVGAGLRLLYHGSIVPDRLPVTVIDALSQLPDHVTLTIVGYETVGSLGYLDRLRKRAAELGISHRVRHAGILKSRPEVMQVCRQHDIGLSLLPLEADDENSRAMAGASNKPFDYLANGLALLVSDVPDWRNLFVTSGYARSCNPADPASIAAAVREYDVDRAGLRMMAEAGRRRVLEEWNYERQFEQVERLL